MKEKERFVEQVREVATTKFGIPKDQVVFYPDGLVAENDDKLVDFIRETNILYSKVESDTLIGNFIVMTLPQTEGNCYYCRLSVDNLMKEWKSGGWDRVSEIISKNIQVIQASQVDITESMSSYENAKPHLIIQPINFPKNRMELGGHVYRRIGDIALTLYIALGEKKGLGILTAKVPRGVIEDWGVDADKVLTEAIHNTYIMAPPRIYHNVKECIDPPFYRGAFMSVNNDCAIEPEDKTVCTTTKKINGAIAFFYPGVPEKIGEMVGESYYVVFTSMHEFRIHRATGASPRDMLLKLKRNNASYPKDMLSNKIFFFDSEKKDTKVVEL